MVVKPPTVGITFGIKKVLNQAAQADPMPKQYKNNFPDNGQVVEQQNEFEFQGRRHISDQIFK